MQSTAAATDTNSSHRQALRPLPQRQRPVPQRSATQEVSQQEQELLLDMLRDDAKAWRTFTHQYSGLIIGCIRRVLGRFSRVTCEHDVDEVYARFCAILLAHDKRKLRAFDPERGSRLSTWVGLLANNATYDYLRRIKRDRVCEPLPETDHFETQLASPFDELATRERAGLARSLIEELSERDQKFVRLYFGEGLNVSEVALQMGISEKTVYTKKHKITARLEKLLSQLRMS